MRGGRVRFRVRLSEAHPRLFRHSTATFTEFTQDEELIRLEAIEFARQNKRDIARKLTDRSIFPSEANPVAVFMAGSTGAGKTEAAKERPASLIRTKCRDAIPGTDYSRCALTPSGPPAVGGRYPRFVAVTNE